MVHLSPDRGSRSEPDVDPLCDRLARRGERLSGASGARPEAAGMRAARARCRRRDCARDLRLDRRDEVPLVHDAVRRGRAGRRAVPPLPGQIFRWRARPRHTCKALRLAHSFGASESLRHNDRLFARLRPAPSSRHRASVARGDRGAARSRGRGGDNLAAGREEARRPCAGAPRSTCSSRRRPAPSRRSSSPASGLARM